MFASPRQIDMVAKVAINAGKRACVTSKPDPKPHSAPIPSAATMAIGIGTPMVLDNQPIPIIDRASTEPTDKSMPPITITAVMPRAMMPSTVSWSSTFSRLRNEKKVSVASDNATHSTNRLSSGPWSTSVLAQCLEERGASARGCAVGTEEEVGVTKKPPRNA